MALTPADLYAKARHFHVDLTTEPFLAPLMKQAIATPLPPQWVAVQGDNHVLYRNEITGESQAIHPADVYFLTQIDELRRLQQHAGDDETTTTSSTGGWIEFDDPNKAPAAGRAGGRASTYFYDFATGTSQPTRPLGATDVSACATSRQATKIFEHAASLHKSPSMKSLESLDILCFTSWWTESALTGSKKSYLQLYFSIPTRHFQIALENADDVFTISHILGPNGRVLSAWDLHVGARVQVLGRWTTLMQPSLLTRQWLDLHQQQFQKMKQELENELLKYELQSGKSRKVAAGQVQCADPHKSTSGVSLRKLINEMETLKSRLANYRPDIARRFVIPFELDLEE